MNKRIKELIDKAYIEVPHERDWDAMSSVFDKEKFAELIVNECRDLVISNFHECRSVSRLDKIIRDHFGVK